MSSIDDHAEFLESVLDHLDEGVYFVDLDRRITWWNRAAEKITGWSADLVVGRMCADGVLGHCDSGGNILCGSHCPLLAAMGDGESRQTQAFMLRRDGARIPVRIRAIAKRGPDGVVNGCVEIFTNDFERLAVLDEIDHLRDEAMKDQLTGLPNRRFLLGRLERLRVELGAEPKPIAVIFLDLDHFKEINDTYGHDRGDEVLRVAAATLRSNLRAHDLIARWGGEEFIVIAPGLSGDALLAFAERLRALIESCEIGRPEVDIRVTASIGCTVLRDAESWAEVSSRADRLMYESKHHGRNRVTLG